MSNHLPVVGSTAATTAFCSATVDVGSGLDLHMDGNGKITAGNGTLLEPKPNAFSLPAQAVTDARLLDTTNEARGPMQDCPGSTPTCRKACYVGPLEKAQAATYALYEANALVIRKLLQNQADADAAASKVAAWITENCQGGFRWHVSGDVFSLRYAEWIAQVVQYSPTVRHWIYTRSFEFLAPLAAVSTLRGGNLALNLSADQDNVREAYRASRRYGTYDAVAEEGEHLRICYLSVSGELPTLGHRDVIFPDYNLRPRQFKTLEESPWYQELTKDQKGMVCPTDLRGKSEKNRCGPCSRCME